MIGGGCAGWLPTKLSHRMGAAGGRAHPAASQPPRSSLHSSSRRSPAGQASPPRSQTPPPPLARLGPCAAPPSKCIAHHERCTHGRAPPGGLCDRRAPGPAPCGPQRAAGGPSPLPHPVLLPASGAAAGAGRQRLPAAAGGGAAAGGAAGRQRRGQGALGKVLREHSWKGNRLGGLKVCCQRVLH